jgi:hypothetical protein
MKHLWRLIFLVSLIWSAHAATKEQDQTVFLFQNRKVVISVPAGLGFSSEKAENGAMVVRVADRKETVSLSITFLPDPEERFTSARTRKEFMAENFHAYVENSVEKAMQFEELEPKTGAGTYCVFTDASLVGKSKPPRGEFLQSTAGVKTWPGVIAVFSLFSNDTASKEYRALMTMLRDSVQESASVPPALAKP